MQERDFNFDDQFNNSIDGGSYRKSFSNWKHSKINQNYTSSNEKK
jgi:hypothetical protein